MASLKLSHIYKVYDNGHKAVNDFSIDIEDKEFIVFVGPSGCGKSTTLRMIAGLETITAGDLFIGDTLVNDMEPKDRDIAMVFQSYALYPHMTVYENMAFGLKNRHLPNDVIKEKVLNAARILDIEEYLDRKPKAMSGGQRQRVALGRALVRDPKVFLLDEPLSNLDAKLRAQMRTEITKLHKSLGTTFIYVTHDQVEAMTMGTRIVVMKLGYVQQIDTPMNLYNEPYNKFVAGFIGSPQMNFFDVTLTRENDFVHVNFGNDSKLLLPYSKLSKIHDNYLHGSKKVIFGIRPEHITLSDEETGFKCYVDAVEHLGNECIIYGKLQSISNEFTLKDDGNNIVVKIIEGPSINVGDTISLKVNEDKVHFFDGDNEVTILKKIPDYISSKGVINEGTLYIFDQAVPVNEVFKNRLDEGLEYNFEISPSSIVKGDSFSLPVLKVENCDGKFLAHLKCGDNVLFALVDENVKEGDDYRFDLLNDKLKITLGDEVLLDEIKEKVEFIGTFSKTEDREIVNGKKERVYHFFYNINGFEIEGPLENGYKINSIDGNNCYKKDYRYLVDRDNIHLNNHLGIEVKITQVLDYGNKKYFKALLNDKEFLLNYDESISLGKAYISFEGSDVEVYSTSIDMKIC